MTILDVDKLYVKNMFVGTIERKGIEVYRKDSLALSVSSATFQIFKRDGTEVTTPAPATIETVDADTVKVSADIHANEAGDFYVEFTYVVGSWTKKARAYYRVYEL